MARGRPLIGIALDSGGAMGGAHVGVLEVLDENGLTPEIIVGASAGAAVGAIYAAGRLAEFKSLITDMSFIKSLSLYVDPVFPYSGLLAGKKARTFIESLTGDILIEDLPVRYVAVATDLLSGETVAVDRGSLTDAVLASISIPGIFSRWCTWAGSSRTAGCGPAAAGRPQGLQPGHHRRMQPPFPHDHAILPLA
jgi:NTE family protein